MDRTLSVQTPESIAFSYELAGIGSRFLALVIDMLIQGVIFAAIVWGLTMLSAGTGPVRGIAAPTTKVAESFAIAIVSALVFIVFFGYFILFEAFWNGRTPGKALMGLRVVRDGGYPLDFTSSVIRNLIRIGELALGFYAISAIACVVSPENKRLGDMAAGTIVVRDSPIAELAMLVAASNDAPRSMMLTQSEHAIIDQFVATARRVGSGRSRTNRRTHRRASAAAGLVRFAAFDR